MSGFLQVSLSTPFTYEKGIRYSESVQWGAFVLSMVYVVVIFGMKAFMSNRKPYNVGSIARIQRVYSMFYLDQIVSSTLEFVAGAVFDSRKYCDNDRALARNQKLWSCL